jgi:hypothetical protein
VIITRRSRPVEVPSALFVDAALTALCGGPMIVRFIEPLRDKKNGALAGYRAYGGGFGHGVGMSQTGAVGMAEKGRGHKEILEHY